MPPDAYSLIRDERLALLEYLAACAIRLSARVANQDGVLAPDDPLLWQIHDVASQYECYEHQRALGFPPRGGLLPQVPTLDVLFDQWAHLGILAPRCRLQHHGQDQHEGEQRQENQWRLVPPHGVPCPCR